MKTVVTAAALVVANFAFAAAPEIRGVGIVQEPSGMIRITYTLAGAPAVVTPDIVTNGVSIGEGNLGFFSGDANRLVDVGPHEMFWRPPFAWPDGVRVEDGSLRAKLTAWSKACPPDYMVVDLNATNGVFFYASAASVPCGVGDIRYKTSCLLMRRIPAAGVEWRMGTPSNEVGRAYKAMNYCDMAPLMVTLTNDYYIGVYEMTKRQYYAIEYGRTYKTSCFEDVADADVRPADFMRYQVMRQDDTSDGDILHPVWPGDGHAVTNGVLSRLRARTGVEFDFPTEAQWEFACRAGSSEPFPPGVSSDGSLVADIDQIGWHKGNWANDPMSVSCGNSNQTHAVGQLLPNAFGLYDMVGNVEEWTVDNASSPYDPYCGVEQVEPVGNAGGSFANRHAARGGDWTCDAVKLRSGCRFSRSATFAASTTGARLACPGVLR